MSKLINKLVAIFVFAYTNKSGNKVNVYVLDGTEDQHKEYLDRVDPQYQPEGGYDDRDNKYPELKGNPAFFSSKFKGNLVEISIPEDTEKSPRINTGELDTALDEADLIGESKRDVLKAYEKSLVKHRASKKTAEPEENKEVGALD